MADIFISYASEDRPWVASLASALEHARGWSPWWDRRIPAGKRFAQVIDQHLKRAECVIVVWSQHSLESSWVYEEADDGRRRGILVPVLKDDVTPPIGFRSIQTARLVDWVASDASPEFDRLLSDIQAVLETPRNSPQGETEQDRFTATLREGLELRSETDLHAFLTAGAMRDVFFGHQKGQKSRHELVSAVKAEALRMAEAGDADGDFLLCFMDLSDPEQRDRWPQAIQRCRRAAERGHAWAQYLLAEALMYGRGVSPNRAEAATWYRHSAERQFPKAQVQLGLMYHEGFEVERDDQKAAVWLRKAAEQNDPEGQYNLAVMYHRGYLPMNISEAIRLYGQAAEQGSAKAQFNLAVIYEKGEGVRQDYDEAARWYAMAASKGHADARVSLVRVKGKKFFRSLLG